MTDNRFDHLRLDKVSRRFGGRAALEALDLHIAGGEFVALHATHIMQPGAGCDFDFLAAPGRTPEPDAR